MCKNSHIIDSSYEWYLKVNDIVDELYACHYSANQRSRSSECKQGGQKRRRESTVNESSIIAPPGLSSFPHLWLLGHEEKSNQLRCIAKRAQFSIFRRLADGAKQEPAFKRST